MNPRMQRRLSCLAGGTLLALASAAMAQIPPSLVTPDKVSTRMGSLDFKDGMPSAATAAKVYDHIDFTHAYNTFVNTMQGTNFGSSMTLAA